MDAAAFVSDHGFSDRLDRLWGGGMRGGVGEATGALLVPGRTRHGFAGFVEAMVLVLGGAGEIDVRGDLAGILSMALALERKKPALWAGLGVMVFMWLRE